jgi:hypothetical protein
MAKKRIYANIEKVEEQDDGTLKVWGYASSGATDSDDEIVTPEAMKAALPDYMKFGAVREMHQASAAGTAIEASVDEATGKTAFGAHVVDPIAVKKVQTGVYKGFSIGGKVTERDPLNKKIIKGLNLIEVSLVDRPANPEAVFTMYKAAATPQDEVEELAELLDAGTVTPRQLLDMVAKAAEGTGSQEAPPQGGVLSTEPAAPPEPVVKSDDVKKGMYSLADFASVLNSIGWLAQDAAWEAEYEADGSPIPAAMAQWLKDGLAIFQAMAAEEAQELAATLTALVDSKAGAADKVAKAGARFSKATKEALGKIHAACKEADSHLTDLKYADEEEAAGSSDDTNKADTIGISTPNPDDAISKAVSLAIAPLNEALEKARKECDDLKAKVDDLSKRAAPGKALLKAVSITKSQDSINPADEPRQQENVPAEGTLERAAYEMKKVFSSGSKRLS